MLEDFFRILPQKFPWWLEKKILLDFPFLAVLTERLLRGAKIKPRRKREYSLFVPGVGEISCWYDMNPFTEIYHWKVYERYFEPEKGDVVVDCGANVGMFSLKAAKKVGKDGLVIALEPEKANVNLLRRNVEANGLDNVIIVQKAVSNRRGKIRLYLSPESPGSHTIIKREKGHFEIVEVDTLDNILSEIGVTKVDFLKIDVEGAEKEVLEGAEKTLNSPNIKVSVAAYHLLASGEREFDLILSFFKSRNFKVRAEEGYIYANRG
ncbi:MAG: FkbM family methyltransferase [Candidatus Hadarchaeales archaeon]